MTNRIPHFIGVIHLPPLPGYASYPGMETIMKKALEDLTALEQGADAIIVENNYDLPHSINVEPPTIAAMTYVMSILKQHTSLPMGTSVLWNDFRAGLGMAVALNLAFVRVPVFVDTVQTDFGVIEGNPEKVIQYRRKIGAEHTAVLADLHVKHAAVISRYPLAESARLAQEHGADGVIVTGQWTGDPPTQEDLATVRSCVPHLPILAGSGVSAGNVHEILQHADGCIVSTSLKIPGAMTHERNVFPWQQRIDPQRVQALKKAILS